MELAILNPVLSAKQALDLGIVTRMVPDAELLATATAFAEELATGPTLAYRGVKRLLIDSAVAGLEEQMGRETETHLRHRMDQGSRVEGIARIRGKAPP